MMRSAPFLVVALAAIVVPMIDAAAEHSGPSAWWETDRPECQVWNAHPQVDEKVTWTGACRAGKADGPGMLTWASPDDTGALRWVFNRGALEAGKVVEWSDTQRPDCRVKFRSMSAFDLTWSGPCAGGKVHGEGKLAWLTLLEDGREQNRQFEGLMQAGELGKGIWSASTGARLEGEWHDGLFTGVGIGVSADGGLYAGDWARGKAHGQGTMTSVDGDRYVGEWKDGKKNGQGTFTWVSGDRYEGSWVDDQRTGQGTYVWANGNRYSGQWQNGEAHGEGVFTWANGDRYEGAWVEGQRTGQGSYVWSNGDRYEGEFKNGVIAGTGTKTWTNGNRYSGQWQNGEGHGEGVFTWANGDRHSGTWKHSKSEGYGLFTTAKGDRYEGNWENDRPEGFGDAWIDGHHYVGHWVSGCMKDGSYVGAIGRQNWECR